MAKCIGEIDLNLEDDVLEGWEPFYDTLNLEVEEDFLKRFKNIHIEHYSQKNYESKDHEVFHNYCIYFFGVLILIM